MLLLNNRVSKKNKELITLKVVSFLFIGIANVFVVRYNIKHAV